MKDVLLSRVPGLADALEGGDHHTVFALLRECVYRTVVWSNDGLLLQHYCGGDLRTLPADEIARLMEAREIGVLCGDTSTFLAKVYTLFGYEASRYYYGIPAVSEHVITVVALPTESGLVPVIQDATFNSTLVLKDAPEPSFVEVMDLLLAGRAAEVFLQKGIIEPRTIGFSDNPEGRAHLKVYRDTDILLEEPRRIVSDVSGTPLLCAQGDLDYESSYLRRHGGRVRAGLARALCKPEEECQVLELMLFPLRMPVLEDPSLHDLIEQLRQRIDDFHRRLCRPETAVVHTPG